MTALTLPILRRAACPLCCAPHCITTDGRLWTHGPRAHRCRGSRLRPEVARRLATPTTPQRGTT